VTRLVCLEPLTPGPAWQPFAGSRPIAELRAGAWRIRDRWAGILGLDEAVVMGNHAAQFADVDSAPIVPQGPVAGPAVVVRSDFAPAGAGLGFEPGVRRLTHEDATVAWIVAMGETWDGPHEQGLAVPIDGMLLQGGWDLITAIERLLPTDCAGALVASSDPVPDGAIVLGDPGDVACFGAAVEPGVVFDVRHGVVVLEEGVQVRSGTRLEGPLFAGPGSLLLGGAIRHSAIGPRCRVHGEMSTTVMLGYANKSHDGFVGHSVIGQWVNLGAGTITSNLKNTYGEVRLDLPGGRLPTGRMNLGTLFGDHAKTAIGTMLSTGTVIGAGANVVGGSVPKWVPPFAWGPGGEESLDAEGFVRIAKRVMPRREVEVDAKIEASLRATHARLAR
jgi:UDP-N-acetylglucosamine diphosphorylase / glucose-1-phosphate thymidylyltransferase / UDP-N-acetylgalactosamine diphosphorylase / glucosamine-1-phosphate N-acetyltransferase / galactosamine-1-phosphate N-acetyltransferase